MGRGGERVGEGQGRACAWRMEERGEKREIERGERDARRLEMRENRLMFKG